MIINKKWNNNKLIKLLFILFTTKYIILIKGLPQDLDSFLEKLFETPECESFISDSSFLAVATIECTPFKCNFPHQLCMRPSNQYQNEAANNCRELPEKCLIAANGGKPLELKTTIKQLIQLNNTTTPSTTTLISRPGNREGQMKPQA
uniref:FZ domain-containing protein n=1 Tax=Meloidogyne hapla TaxID=6305 RepID=A0A1I8C171_MELHA